jgi:cell fate regulator YaaT (PSP1 superfamily)
VVETNRGVECGKVDYSYDCSSKKPKRQNVVIRKVLREATLDDLKRLKDLDAIEADNLKKAKKIVGGLSKDVVIKRCELVFDRKRVYIHFIEFKEKKKDKKNFKIHDLVKELSSELNCKVEFKEAGLRGLAKVLGGVGICGRSLCCSSVLNETKSVSVRFAKDQGIAMNPKNLCGVCSKLKCCIRYEKDNYVDGSLDIGEIAPKKEEPWDGNMGDISIL